MKTTTRYTEAQIEEMRKLRKTGLTVKEVVKATGFSATAVNKYTGGMLEGNQHLVGTGEVRVTRGVVLQSKKSDGPKKYVRVDYKTVLEVDANKSEAEVRAAYERRYCNGN